MAPLRWARPPLRVYTESMFTSNLAVLFAVAASAVLCRRRRAGRRGASASASTHPSALVRCSLSPPPLFAVAAGKDEADLRTLLVLAGPRGWSAYAADPRVPVQRATSPAAIVVGTPHLFSFGWLAGWALGGWVLAVCSSRIWLCCSQSLSLRASPGDRTRGSGDPCRGTRPNRTTPDVTPRPPR